MSNKLRVAGNILLLALLGLFLTSGVAFAKVMEIESRDEPTYIEMVPGENKKVLTDHNLRRIVVGDPDIIEIKVLTRNRVSIIAKGLGNSSLNLTGEGPTASTSIYVHVAPDVITLKQRINQLFPGQDIKIYANKNGIILAGTVTGTEIVEQVLRLTQQILAVPEREQGAPAVKVNNKVKSEATEEELAQIIADTKEVTVVAGKGKSGGAGTGTSSLTITNLMKVSGSQQVLLEVKLAEVNRESTRELQAGIGLGKLGNDFSGGFSSSGSVLTPFDVSGATGVIPGGKIGVLNDITVPGLSDAPGSLFLNLSDAANVFVNIDNFTAMLRFIETENLGRILAEPKLVTMNGQEASFLAGGEYPFQTIDADGQSDIDFKEFGVGLRFTPIVNSDGMITLRVSPSVTDIAELIDTATGPQAVFSTRKLNSTVQLRDGQTLALAGLLQDNLSEAVSKIPFLGDIPYLGALFRSTEYRQRKTDLLIAVTPHLIAPVREGEISFPGEFVKPPSRYEFYLEGRLEGRRSANDPSAIMQHNFTMPAMTENGGLEGEFGHTHPAN